MESCAARHMHLRHNLLGPDLSSSRTLPPPTPTPGVLPSPTSRTSSRGSALPRVAPECSGFGAHMLLLAQESLASRVLLHHRVGRHVSRFPPRAPLPPGGECEPSLSLARAWHTHRTTRARLHCMPCTPQPSACPCASSTPIAAATLEGVVTRPHGRAARAGGLLRRHGACVRHPEQAKQAHLPVDRQVGQAHRPCVAGKPPLALQLCLPCCCAAVLLCNTQRRRAPVETMLRTI